MKTWRLLASLALLAGCQRSVPPAAGPGPASPPSASPSGPAGGTDFGGGTEAGGRQRQAHWFPTKRSIRACVRISPRFGMSESAARRSILTAFDTWNDYAAMRAHEAADLSVTPTLGPCDADTDVEFMLGVDDERVRAAKAHYDLPVALASFDGRRGIVWIGAMGSVSETVPNWRRPNALLATLLHETGHIFGNEHVDGTVMAADLGDHLDTLPAAWLSRIDHSRALLPCLECPETYVIDWAPGFPGANEEQREAMIALMGAIPQPSCQVRLSKNFSLKTANFQLHIATPGRILELASEREVLQDMSFFPTGRRVFQLWSAAGARFFENGGVEIRGRWRDAGDRELELIYAVNTLPGSGADGYQDMPVRIDLVSQGRRLPLFGFPADSALADPRAFPAVQ